MVVIPTQLKGADTQFTYFNYQEPWLTRIKETPYGPNKPNKSKLESNRRNERVGSSVLTIKYEYEGYTKEQLGNCYNFVKDDILIGYGDARNHPAPLKAPEIGSIMVSYESKSGHYARVLGVLNDEFIIGEFNFVDDAYTERVIKKNNPIIKGFYRKT